VIRPEIKIAIFFVITLGLIVNYQNCSVYQSENRKDLDAKGFNNISVNQCLPYIDANDTKRVWQENGYGYNTFELSMHDDSAVDDPDTVHICTLGIAGSGKRGLNGAECELASFVKTLAAESLDGGTPQLEEVESLIDDAQYGPAQFSGGSFAYTKLATVNSVDYTIFAYVGADERDELPMGVRCYFTFKHGEYDQAKRDEVWPLARDLVEVLMFNYCDRQFDRTSCSGYAEFLFSKP
jgi:hypothetical protein